MNPFVRFMQTPAGRAVRVVGGVSLIAVGLLGVGGVTGYVMAAAGLVPLAAGLFDFCLFAPIFRIPFSGERIRAMK